MVNGLQGSLWLLRVPLFGSKHFSTLLLLVLHDVTLGFSCHHLATLMMHCEWAVCLPVHLLSHDWS
jgi:hypothetical protein